ncbi:MAG: hypothetical protein GXP34_08820 [Actinobacteria bacterium]|nr:hypothetical protein [Actinomycetota bacterium]
MSTYLSEIARRDNRVVRVGDFRVKDAGPELRRLAAAGALLRLATGYYALVPEAYRGPASGWRPTVEAAALGIATADYGTDRVALLGPSAARLHGCYPRALSAAVVAVPNQRPRKPTVAGSVKFVVRDVSKLDLVRASTELTPGWMTSVEQTLLDLSGDWPRWLVTESAREEMIRLLALRASPEILEEVAAASRGRAALERVRRILDDLRR